MRFSWAPLDVEPTL